MPRTAKKSAELPGQHGKKTGRRGIGPAEILERHPPVAEPRLPGMEDAAIEELESAAAAYAGIRDRRQALTSEEVPLKKSLLDLMHAHKKQEYNHAGISIKVVHEKENVKVRIKREEE